VITDFVTATANHFMVAILILTARFRLVEAVFLVFRTEKKN